VPRPDTPADSVARLEQTYAAATTSKLRRGGEAGGACANDGNIECGGSRRHPYVKVVRCCQLGQTECLLGTSWTFSTAVDVIYLRV
jgi:hypothetical protein